MSERVMCYVGRDACGCLVSCIVDHPGEERYIAQYVADLIQEGLVIERMTVDEARQKLGHKCGKATNAR